MRRRGQPRRRSVDRGTHRPGIEPRNPWTTPGCRRRGDRRKATPGAPPARGASGLCAVRDPEHVRKHRVREPGDPGFACGRGRRRTHREVQGRTPMRHGSGKSDSLVVPAKPPNKAAEPAAEAGEGSGLAKGVADHELPLKSGPLAAPHGVADGARSGSRSDASVGVGTGTAAKAKPSPWRSMRPSARRRTRASPRVALRVRRS
jgi:hypothetical protein